MLVTLLVFQVENRLVSAAFGSAKSAITLSGGVANTTRLPPVRLRERTPQFAEVLNDRNNW